MQIQKDEIRNRILAVASREFINNGVKRTSIKTIASKANVAVGNVYNYYKGKDDLLRAVLALYSQPSKIIIISLLAKNMYLSTSSIIKFTMI